MLEKPFSFCEICFGVSLCLGARSWERRRYRRASQLRDFPGVLATGRPAFRFARRPTGRLFPVMLSQQRRIFLRGRRQWNELHPGRHVRDELYAISRVAALQNPRRHDRFRVLDGARGAFGRIAPESLTANLRGHDILGIPGGEGRRGGRNGDRQG